MNRTALSVVALAVGSVLLMGLFNVYKPQTKHVAHDVFDKVRIGNMQLGQSATGNHHNLAPNHRYRGYGQVHVHFVDISNDPQANHLSSDPDIDDGVTMNEEVGTRYNGYMINNEPHINGHDWTNTGKHSDYSHVTYQKNTPNIYVGCLPVD